MPRTVSASAISERWQRQGTASAHSRAARSPPGPLQELLEALLALGGEHVVGVPLEGGVLPAGVGGVGPAPPQAAQPRQLHVADAGRAQGGGQGVPVELGVVPRARHLAHVRDQGDAVGLQEPDELRQRPGRMAHRQDQHRGDIRPALPRTVAGRRGRSRLADGSPPFGLTAPTGDEGTYCVPFLPPEAAKGATFVSVVAPNSSIGPGA